MENWEDTVIEISVEVDSDSFNLVDYEARNLEQVNNFIEKKMNS